MLCRFDESAHVEIPEVNHWYRAYAELLERERQAWHQPGLAVAVVDGLAPVLVAGYGVRAAGAAPSVRADTVFALASCSKPFAAATVALLVEQGKLAWDAPVRQWLPELALYDPAVTAQLTVRDLLCNRVGLHSSEGRFRALAQDRSDLVRRLAGCRPLHAFRDTYAYQTDMFTLAGELVTRVSGMDWARFAETALWRPLGMRRTGADHVLAQRRGNWARPHQHLRGEPCMIDWIYEDHVATPAGGVNSSAADMARWLTFWNARGGGLLSAASVKELVTPHTPIRGEYAEDEFSCAVGTGPGAIRMESYALGWYVHDDAGDTVVVHTGSIAGYKATAGFLWDRRIGIAIMANSDATYFPRAMFQAGIDLARGRDPEPRLQTFRMLQAVQDRRREAEQALPVLTVTAPERYAGDYADDGCWGTLRITAKEGMLSLMAGTQPFRIERIGKAQFRMAAEQGRPHPSWIGLHFLHEGAQVVGLRMEDGTELHRVGPSGADGDHPHRGREAGR